jgi:ABC-type transporter MlaC component
MFKRVAIAIVVFGLAVAQTGIPSRAQNNGKEAVQELVTLFSAWSDQRGRRNIFDAAAQHIDYQTMAEMAFTRPQWDSFTVEQKREMVQSFRSLVENRYYKRWHKLFLRSHLNIANEAKAGSDTYVKTYLTQGKDDDTVIWRLHPRGGELMVVDLNVNGRDLITRLSERFQKQLKKRGANGLIAWIKEQAHDDKDEDEISTLRAAAK